MAQKRIDAQLVDLVCRVADALLTPLKIRMLRNELWRQSHDPRPRTCQVPASLSRFVLGMLLKARTQDIKKRYNLRNLKRLERRELRAATRYRWASKARAELHAIHALRAPAGAPPED